MGKQNQTTRKKVILASNMSQLTLAEQEEVWQLSRYNDVYERDINGVLWQVLDLTDDQDQDQDQDQDSHAT